MDLSLESCLENETLKNDRISELQDDILLNILYLLPMKDAGRTCLLSKRWRYVWAYLRGLYFGYDEYMDEDASDTESADEEYLGEERSKYACWVDQIISSHKAPAIDEFIVIYDLLDSCKDNIDNWLRFAVEKKVKRLKLNVAPSWIYTDKTYTFPSLPFCNSLTFLQLFFVGVSGEILEKFLSDCPNLEILSVNHSDSLVGLKVVGPSLKLNFLKLQGCDEIKHLEISAPNLEVFHYSGPKISPYFKTMPKLTELDIRGEYADHLLSDFRDLTSFIPQIEVLTLHSTHQKTCLAEVFPIFTRVKTLNIHIYAYCEVQLFRLRFLLNACPLLHKFVFSMGVLGPKFEQTSRTEHVEVCPHYQLKILEIVPFVGWEVDTAFVKYLIDCAVSLEKVVILPSCIPTEEETSFDKNRDRAIEKANELRSELKSGTTFEIISD